MTAMRDVPDMTGRKRRLGIMLGSGGAVVVRVACTFVVAQLLNMRYVKLVGGAVIIWIAVKLLTEGAEEEGHSLWQALWVIIVADLSMGINNMLAVGAASHGNLFLLWTEYASMAFFVVFVCGLSKWMLMRQKAAFERQENTNRQ